MTRLSRDSIIESFYRRECIKCDGVYIDYSEVFCDDCKAKQGRRYETVYCYRCPNRGDAYTVGCNPNCPHKDE